MAGLLANACSEEPDALIALVRVCGGAPRVTGGSTRKIDELWRRVARAGLFQGRHPATLRVPALRRGVVHQSSLRETRFPHEGGSSIRVLASRGRTLRPFDGGPPAREGCNLYGTFTHYSSGPEKDSADKRNHKTEK